MKNIYISENRILVEPINTDQTESGLYIPENSQEKGSQRGIVKAVGIRRIEHTGQRFDSQFAPGDEVVYSQYAGTKVRVDGKDYIVVREEDVMLSFGNRAV